jgi:hypothetical protein
MNPAASVLRYCVGDSGNAQYRPASPGQVEIGQMTGEAQSLNQCDSQYGHEACLVHVSCMASDLL